MIKEYEEVKIFMDRKISSNFLNAAVVIEDMFMDEFDAFEIRIIGSEIPSEYYIKFKQTVFLKYSHIVKMFNIVSSPNYVNTTTIIVYLKPIMEIRSGKIDKIKSNILI